MMSKRIEQSRDIWQHAAVELTQQLAEMTEERDRFARLLDAALDDYNNLLESVRDE